MTRNRRIAFSIGILLVSVMFELLFDNKNEKLLVLLLITEYIILYIDTINITAYIETTVGFILNIIIFVRLFLLPLLILIDADYMTNIPLGYGQPNSEYFTYGVLLTLFEGFVIGLYLKRRLGKLLNYRTKQNCVNGERYYINTNMTVLYIAIVILIAFTLLDSSVWDGRQMVFSLLKVGKSSLTFTNKLSTRSTLASISMRNAILLLPIPFFTYSYSKYIKYRTRKYYYSCLFFLIVGYGLYIEGSSRASILIPLLVSMIIMKDLFPKVRRKTLLIFGLFTGIVLLITTIWKTYVRTGQSISFDLDELVEMLELYFVGISNMGKAVKAKIDSGIVFRLDYFMNDFFTTFPGLSHLTNQMNTATIWFNKVSGRADQIMPAIGNGMFYFGMLFSPLVTVLQIETAIWIEKRAIKAKTLSKYVVYTYGTVMLIYGCFSSMVIFVQKLVISFALSAIIVTINEALRVKNEH